MVSIKHIVAVAALGTFSIPALAGFNYFWRIDDARYRQGDCITPTDQSLSFYGHYARVEGVASFDGTTEPGAYVLSFPIFVPRTPLYPQSIDDKTQQVSNEFCVRQNVK